MSVEAGVDRKVFFRLELLLTENNQNQAEIIVNAAGILHPNAILLAYKDMLAAMDKALDDFFQQQLEQIKAAEAAKAESTPAEIIKPA